jgi:hypothetical protein
MEIKEKRRVSVARINKKWHRMQERKNKKDSSHKIESLNFSSPDVDYYKNLKKIFYILKF